MNLKKLFDPANLLPARVGMSNIFPTNAAQHFNQEKYAAGFRVVLIATAVLLFVIWLIELFLHYKNRPKDTEEFKACPHCGEMIPELSIECMECRKSVNR